MMDDLQKAFDEGFEAVRGYVDRSFADFERRLGAIESRAAPVDGRDGVNGERGEKGLDGANGKDGRDGVDGRPGEKGIPGDAGKDGAPGAAGRGVAKLLIDAKGHLVVTFTDGATDDVGLVVGKDGAPGANGRDGVDGAPGVDGKSGADGINGRDGEKGLDGTNGRDGIDGKDGTDGKSIEPEVVAQMVQDEVAKANVCDLVRKAVDAMPKPENGKDGKDGRDGVDGAKGLDGKDGAAGHDGKDGLRGEPGEKGLDGKDGVGLSDAVIDRDGNLVLTMTDGRHKALGLVLGKDGIDGQKGADGAPGRDGVDGLGFDDLSLEYDGERSVSIKFQRGDVIKEFPLTLPIVLDRGVWQERGMDGAGYKQGDGVSWGGSFYIARKDTFAKPDDFESWRLSVKRGKDGKESVSLK